ncbi:hypothetical protein GOD70_32920, partial [Sinorhizobium medicae]|nr:hypothetical protein [Sinorhizobium medicae]
MMILRMGVCSFPVDTGRKINGQADSHLNAITQPCGGGSSLSRNDKGPHSRLNRGHGMRVLLVEDDEMLGDAVKTHV